MYQSTYSYLQQADSQNIAEGHKCKNTPGQTLQNMQLRYKTVYFFYNQFCLLSILEKSSTAEIPLAPSFFLISPAVF